MNNPAEPGLQTSSVNPSLSVTTPSNTPPEPEKFTPTGAIAFFVALIILCLIIWYGVYFLMLSRT